MFLIKAKSRDVILWIFVLVIVFAAFAATFISIDSTIDLNERNAATALKAYASAQALFIKNKYSLLAGAEPYMDSPSNTAPSSFAYDESIPMYAYPFSDLYYVRNKANGTSVPISLISEKFANAAISQNAYNGYYFFHGIVKKPDTLKFDLYATPAQYGIDGHYTFYIDQSGIIKMTDLKKSLSNGEVKSIDPFSDPRWKVLMAEAGNVNLSSTGARP